MILLPTRTVTALTRTQLRAVLAHELAHVRRGDYVANLAALEDARGECRLVVAAAEIVRLRRGAKPSRVT